VCETARARDLRALSPVEGIVEAFIYGSWAARWRGEVGPALGGVDLLVVGTPDRNAASDALGCGKAETDSSRYDKMDHGRMPSECVVRTEGVC